MRVTLCLCPLLALGLMGCPSDIELHPDDPTVKTGPNDPGHGSPVGAHVLYPNGHPSHFAPDVDEEPPEKDPCTGTQTTLDWQVVFEETVGCDWDNGSNLSQRQAYFRAQKEQVQRYELDPETTICDVRFEFSKDQGGIMFPLQYDDHLLFTFNERVVFSSYSPLLDPLAHDTRGYAIFDWLAVRDMEMTFSASPWAIGTDYTLELPDSDVAGDARIEIDTGALSDLTQSALVDNEIDFQLHIFGDDNYTDCGHTGISFWVEVDVATGD